MSSDPRRRPPSDPSTSDRGPAIELQGVSKVYRLTPHIELRRLLNRALDRRRRAHDGPGCGVRYALRDVNLVVEPRESLGVIGRNGAGKTTLLRLLAGVTLPTTGRIRIAGHVASLIGVGIGFHPELTGRENVYLYCALMGLRTSEIRARIGDILDFADVGEYIDVAFKRYSSGMMARLGFAAALHVEPDILLLDEVLAVGDHRFHAKSMAAMRRLAARCTVVFVSHSLESVRDLCPRAVWLDAGAVRADGPVAGVIRDYLAAQRAGSAVPAS
jgi:ABC-type polysaccharide/polyol phosphate transport system ATPase subunit